MTDQACEEMQFLLQADLDGELRPAEAARLAAHLPHCPDCAATQTRLLALSQRLRDALPPPAVPAALRAAITAAIAAAAPARSAAPRPRWVHAGAGFAAGMALAACLTLVVRAPAPGTQALTEAVVTAHIRALQPGHLIDIPSTDQHTVKPWFDGRLPYAPPVRDFAAAGFPLAGGRLDYVGGRPVAALVYRRGLHVIELFVWPADAARGAAADAGSRDGYNFARWQQDGMMFWAVSDLNARELAAFAALWRL